MSERDLAAQVAELARLFGWRRYHTWRSIHSPAGFPDEVLVRGDRLVFAELKSETGKPTPEQGAWLDALAAARNVQVFLWRPADFAEISRTLR